MLIHPLKAIFVKGCSLFYRIELPGDRKGASSNAEIPIPFNVVVMLAISASLLISV